MWISPISIFLIFTQLLTAATSLDSETNCTHLRNVFANSTSAFISCAIYNSRPITLCESCVDFYMKIIESYDNMKQFLENDTHCIDKLINLDRLQIVQTMYSNSYELWNDAKCYECFQFIDGTLTPNKSVETITFNEKYDKFMKCVDQSNINDTPLCPTCMEAYLDLDDYYNSISNENEKIGVCMDIVDLMNTTHAFWSLKCCKYRKHAEYIFLASTVTVLIMTLCFYVVVQLCTVKRTPTILQQTRFAESLNHFNQPE